MWLGRPLPGRKTGVSDADTGSTGSAGSTDAVLDTDEILDLTSDEANALDGSLFHDLNLDAESAKWRPATCPDCGGRVVPIWYGLPSEAGWARIAAGEAVGGGCMSGPNAPVWCCQDCGRRGGRHEDQEREIGRAFAAHLRRRGVTLTPGMLLPR
jgi:hypothetical protein